MELLNWSDIGKLSFDNNFSEQEKILLTPLRMPNLVTKVNERIVKENELKRIQLIKQILKEETSKENL